MSWWQIMRRIVLPQALRTAVPALSNSLIGMIKDTSLASNITVAELFMAGQRVAARTYIFLPIYCEVAVVYLLFCTVITKLQALLERQLNARGFQSKREVRTYGYVRDLQCAKSLPHLCKTRPFPPPRCAEGHQ